MSHRALLWILATVSFTIAACGAAVTPGDGGDVAPPDHGGPDVIRPDGSDVVPPPEDVVVSCTLPDGSQCPVGETCPLGDGCSACTCMPDGTATCIEGDCVDAGPPGCHSASDCTPGEICQFPLGCGANGTCAHVRDCFAQQPFCACDGLTYSGCVPTQPTLHAGECEGPDAGTHIDCDPQNVTCPGIEPSCGPDMVPSVSAGCWGPCVPFDRCDAIACDPTVMPRDPNCPQIAFCDSTTRVCNIGRL